MGNININWMGDNQRLFLERGYLKKGVTPEQRFETICQNIEKWCNKNTLNNISISDSLDYVSHEDKIYTLDGIADRFRTYISKNWCSFASPILSNFGESNGLPISCNHGKVYDSLNDILKGITEMGMLGKYGAGTAKNFSNIRAIGEKISTGGTSEGVIEWIELYAHAMSKITQGSIRRGFLTAYLSVSHTEILEFLEIGTKKFSNEKAEFFNSITTAVTIPKNWMSEMLAGDEYKRDIWLKILETRSEVGYPYILFEDNCNINCSQVYIDKNMWIDNSNICIECPEYCDEEKEFACCLSSVNLYKFDEWQKDNYFIKDMYVMLDCVISEYIEKGKKLLGIEKAIKFAEEHRAIGLGTFGFHSYLQKNNVVFGDLQSYQINYKIFSHLRSEGEFITQYMAKKWGEPKILKGYNRRNTSLMAQAPTKSTAFIFGFQDTLSASIEPRKSNYNEKDLAKIQVTEKNKELVVLLESKKRNDNNIWKSILKNNGSVQHLDFLTEHEKNVFKTFSEISQVDIIKLASQRQEYIDMGQSINLMVHPNTSVKDIHNLHILAHEEGLKSLYYQYSINAAQQFNKKLMECSSCEG